MSRRCVVIGSGLGGLSTAVVLARGGYDVTVLEQGRQIGGCLQCFDRNGVRFETGMHFVGSLDEGQVLSNYLRFFGIKDRLTLSRLDRESYDVVSLRGERFAFANGAEQMMAAMSDRFPRQRDSLHRYWRLVEEVAQASPYFRLGQERVTPNPRLFSASINQVLEEVVDDELLRDVLVGNMSLYAARRNVTPFATSAFVNHFYNESAFRIVGGSQTVADALSDELTEAGGRIITDSRVVKVRCRGGVATTVVTADGNGYDADVVVCDVHPSQLRGFFSEGELRPVYLDRVDAIANTPSVFSLFVKFKRGRMPYMNSNFYGYACPSPWDMLPCGGDMWPKGYLYMHHCHEPHPLYAQSGVVLAYMSASELAAWQHTTTGVRGEGYAEWKRCKAEQLMSAVEHDFPHFREAVECYYTATPLTYRDYTLTPDGSMYGLEHNVANGTAGRVSYRTKVPNFLLVGQNVNAHGMLGVLTGVLTVCSHILGEEYVKRQMCQANGVDAMPPPRPYACVMGGGLGGLLTAALLTHKGYRVSVLEKNIRAGGGLDTFERHGVMFETGMHVFGGFQPGGNMRRLCSYLGVLEGLDLCPTDADCVDEVMMLSSGHRLRLPRGREAFTQYLCDCFPHESEGIRAYVDSLYSLVHEEDLFYLRPEEHDAFSHSEMFLWPVDRLLSHFISDEELCGLLAYLAPLYAGVRGVTPAYIHALVSVLHIEGTARFASGGRRMAELLAEVVRRGGGEVMTGDKVTGYEVEDRHVTQIHTEQGRTYRPDVCVSDLPTQVLLDVSPQGAFPPSFRHRLEQAPGSYSAFKVYLRLRDGVFLHSEHPCYCATDAGAVWKCVEVEEAVWPVCMMWLTHPGADVRYAESMTVICPMAAEWTDPWADSVSGRRGDDYRAWKEACVQKVLSRLEQLLPTLRENVEWVEASSPLTIRDFLGNGSCAMFGLQRDCNNMMQSQLSVFTKVKNLYLTGQDVNIHGLCGVALTAISTVEAVTGDRHVREEM